MWVVASRDADFVGKVIPLERDGRWTIGRGDAAVRIRDDWMSRCHFEVVTSLAAQDGAQWVLRDNGTRNGTFVNGHQVRGCQLLPGDVVRAGSTLFCLESGVPPGGESDLGLVGWSEALAEVRDHVRVVSRDAQPVHISGESGSGKEMVARAIHDASERRGPFLPLNMAALVAGLAESQLFGHRRGAFSGASADQPGAFEAAEGGTLLLDEIGELELSLQAKLLRAVETTEVHRVGDARPRPVDVRLITTTHRDLASMVEEATFREDLYWRLAHCEIHMPPLRERRLDIIPVFEHMLRLAGTESTAEFVTARPETACHMAELLERLVLYPWPGNVRELRQEALHFKRQYGRRGAVITGGGLPTIDETLSRRLRSGPWRLEGRRAEVAPRPSVGEAEVTRMRMLLKSPMMLRHAIDAEASGNVKAFAEMAAEVLGTNPESVRRTIYRRLGAARP